MGLSIIRLLPNRVSQRRLFPDWIEADDWVLFHGTSGVSAEAIERDGFDGSRGAVSPAQIRRVVSVFERMKWCGDNGGGYPILKPFSLDHDFQGTDHSLSFFAETSMRALLYATRDFSGGEKLRALRYAFEDLDSYLADSRLRQRHFDLMQAEFDQLSAVNASSATLEAVRPIVVDLVWLRQQLANLTDVRRIAGDAFARHDHGVVYALRVAEEDVAHLRWNTSMGVETAARIPASAILGKLIVPPEYEMDEPGRTADDPDRTQRGLLAFLLRKSRNAQGR